MEIKSIDLSKPLSQPTTLNAHAAKIKRELRTLINKTIDLSLATSSTRNGTGDLRIEATNQLKVALRKLREAEAALGDLFADEHCDNPRFGFSISEEDSELAKLIELYGNTDGTVKRIVEAGFRIVEEHGGSSGWKETIEHGVIYVDHWGAVYAKAKVGDRVWSPEGNWVVWNGSKWVAE